MGRELFSEMAEQGNSRVQHQISITAGQNLFTVAAEHCITRAICRSPASSRAMWSALGLSASPTAFNQLASRPLPDRSREIQPHARTRRQQSKPDSTACANLPITRGILSRQRTNHSRAHIQWLPSRSHAIPSTDSKWRSADTRSAPVSMAWAAIHTSLVGMGLPLARSAAATLE